MQPRTRQKHIFLILVLTFNHLLSFSQIELPDSIRKMLTDNPKVIRIKYDSIYYSTGQLMLEGWFYESNFLGLEHDKRQKTTISIRVGTWKCYDKKGRVKEIHMIPLYDSLTSVIQFFDNSGFKKAEHRYKSSENELEPTYKQDYKLEKRINKYNRIKYFRNGTIKYDINFCGLKFCGHYKEYYSNGQMKYLYFYNENGKTDGTYQYFDQMGTIRETGQYKNGTKFGTWKAFDNNGTLEKEKKYTH